MIQIAYMMELGPQTLISLLSLCLGFFFGFAYVYVEDLIPSDIVCYRHCARPNTRSHKFSMIY
ncbi:hypothetical protein HanRHA438_Chr17g0833511 [Helianthus annuus]|uniref:Uncharacterized protein n=1 Tax=Helianthus annuus TaxID=4232 RepID=A0A9K3DKM3_HELAN|nr:hypothetical protein HanXRQr2_Chr17g0823601 [Helianthus annuus]KAJ0435497.1 hypothetical protein HanIR_Chr17g0893931 [Helianthus annuus]KAJ0633906.1 hypothetical protein HanLR1_Chr17g0682071 [Helianthus annuus]KAJ0814885.1 hypothetical protein HanPSC8_Chr17g0791011 [Helianthus annuus]KAJ0828115.1 hypothetical protein HanRHA438_Chr17g0833511 [Helianthus annuus]